MVKFNPKYEINAREFKPDFKLSNTYSPDYGEITIVERDSAPYTGDMVVTPGDTLRVLPTDGKKVQGNIVVNPIPQNYGKISWNGSTMLIT